MTVTGLTLPPNSSGTQVLPMYSVVLVTADGLVTYNPEGVFLIDAGGSQLGVPSNPLSVNHENVLCVLRDILVELKVANAIAVRVNNLKDSVEDLMCWVA